MKKKTYIPNCLHIIMLLVCGMYIISIFVIGPPGERALIRHRSAYLAVCTLFIPLIILTVTTFTWHITISKESIKMRWPIELFPKKKIFEYKNIKKIEIEQVKLGGRVGYNYKIFLQDNKEKKGDATFGSLIFLIRRKELEKDMAALAEMINSKNALENLENKEDQVLPPSE